MRCLAIETSCDESAACVLERSGDGFTILAEEISSQTAVHEAYGGVVPELASREHLRNLPILVDAVLHRSGSSVRDLTVIAATRGPGLKGCLMIGLNFAKGLALAHGVPLLGVNHIEGHLLAPLLDVPDAPFPHLSLVVSGGHTEIHEVSGIGRYRLVARTTDDAAGEAFDKAAHLLGLSYPGGAKLAAIADKFRDSPDKKRFSLPKVMREAEGFSFSGLKTAIALLVQRNSALLQDEQLKGALCAVIQESIVDALVFKLREAQLRLGAEFITVTGGVSANALLRERVLELAHGKAAFPLPHHCMDNAAMIAHVGALRFERGERSPLSEEVRARWPVEGMD